MKILITESQLKTITESLTQTDKSEIERMIRKEIKDLSDEAKFKKKIKDVVDDVHKSGDFDKKIVEISKNVLIQLFKELYNKRSTWTSGLSNNPS